MVNDTYAGGVVRQYGNLSFSRVYDAGHLIAAYQPKTAVTIFARVIMGTDIATEEPADLSIIFTSGDANATHLNTPGPQQTPRCWIRNVLGTCTSKQQAMLLQSGTGYIVNGVLYDDPSQWQEPSATLLQNAGTPGSLPSSSLSPTGVTIVSSSAGARRLACT